MDLSAYKFSFFKFWIFFNMSTKTSDLILNLIEFKYKKKSMAER